METKGLLQVLNTKLIFWLGIPKLRLEMGCRGNGREENQSGHE